MPVAAVIVTECEAPTSRYQNKYKRNRSKPAVAHLGELQSVDQLAEVSVGSRLAAASKAFAEQLQALQALSGTLIPDEFASWSIQRLGFGVEVSALANSAAFNQAVSAVSVNSYQGVLSGIALASIAACNQAVGLASAALADTATLNQLISANIGDYNQAAGANIAALNQAMSAVSRDIMWPASPGAVASESAGSVSSTHLQMSPMVEVDLWQQYWLIGLPRSADDRDYQAQLAFWAALGVPGIDWLMDRLREPADLRCIWAISGLLSDLAPASISLIVDRLELAPTFNEAIAMLSALEGVNASSLNESQRLRLHRVLSHFLLHADDAVRGKAAAATVVLDRESAAELLREALAQEADDDVRLSLKEELAARGCQ